MTDFTEKFSCDKQCDACVFGNTGKMASKSAWSDMKDRCYNPNNAKYQIYGGRGIEVCDRWRNSYEAYRNDMGPRPTDEEQNGRPIYTVDRYPDKDGNYEPDNCRWADPKEQSRNRNNTVWTEYQGRKITVDELSEISGVRRALIYRRVLSGKSGDDLIKPPHVGKVIIEGVEYIVEELSKKYGVPGNTIRDRVRTGKEKTFSEVVSPENLPMYSETYEYKDEMLSVPEIVKRTGISEGTIRQRIELGDRGDRLIREVVVKKTYVYKGVSLFISELSQITGIPKTSLYKLISRNDVDVTDKIALYLLRRNAT